MAMTTITLHIDSFTDSIVTIKEGGRQISRALFRDAELFDGMQFTRDVDRGNVVKWEVRSEVTA